MKTLLIAGLISFVVIVLLVVIMPFLLGVEVSSPTPRGRDDQGVFMTRDSGSAWEARNSIKDSKSKLSGLAITDFVIDPADHERLYIGTRNSGIWKSPNRGEYWERVEDKAGVLQADAEVLRIAISRTNPKLWFAAVYQKNRGVLLKSEDGGETFREVYFVPVERFGVFDVWVDDASRSVFIVTGQGGFLESRDFGKSWRVIRWFSDGVIRLVPHPHSGSTFYLLTSRGMIFKTIDRASTWVDLSPNFQSFERSTANQNLTIDAITGTLYLGSDHGLIRSHDGGSSWESVPVIIPPEVLPVLAVAIHPFDARTYFISAKSQIYKTTDGGITWSIISSPTERRVTRLVMDRREPSLMYLVSNR